MDKKESIKQQKFTGTYQRNLKIIKLVKLGIPQAEVARRHGISRQAVNNIILRSKGAKCR